MEEKGTVTIKKEGLKSFFEGKLQSIEDKIDLLEKADPFSPTLLAYQRASMEVRLFLEEIIADETNWMTRFNKYVHAVAQTAVNIYAPLIPREKWDQALAEFNKEVNKTIISMLKTDFFK